MSSRSFTSKYPSSFGRNNYLYYNLHTHQRTVFEGILGIHNIVTVISITCITSRIDVGSEYVIIGERYAISNRK